MAAVRESDPELRMPRNGKLTARQVDQLGRWIKSGAVFPVQGGRDRILRDPNHWSFHSLRSPKLPGVKNPNWPRTPIDRFILARLDAEGIAPAADVDRRAWLGRVTFDLVGLPPSPEQLADFLGDRTPGARSGSSIDCWHRLGMERGGDVTGSTSPAMPIRTGLTKTWRTVVPGDIEITSSSR
ncbi:MAG: hypothetical protein Ct9H300mP1_34070 [Planctomycetaceae bacterium]|nr:MAG: hypothetical protein Ct9H300mP1_34070 [Planctomycetaceae bacterium]